MTKESAKAAAADIAGVASAITTAMGTIRKSLDTVRCGIAERRARREAIAWAPVTREVAVQRLDAALERLAGEFMDANLLAYLMAPDESEDRGSFKLTDIFAGDHYRQDNVDAVLAALFGPELRKRLIARLDAAYRDKSDGQPALSAQERAAQLAAIDDEIAALERQEVEIMHHAASIGLDLTPRADLSPAAFLGIDDEGGSLVDQAAADDAGEPFDDEPADAGDEELEQ